jgi:hypothetical protein
MVVERKLPEETGKRQNIWQQCVYRGKINIYGDGRTGYAEKKRKRIGFNDGYINVWSTLNCRVA